MIAKHSKALGVFLLLACPTLVQAKEPVPDVITLIKSKGVEDRAFALLVQIHLKPGVEQKFKEAALKAGQATLKEAGCSAYDFHNDADKPDTIVLFEKWANVSALEAHLNQPHTKALIQLLEQVVAEPISLRILVPVSTK